jgi:hypothetical protein
MTSKRNKKSGFSLVLLGSEALEIKSEMKANEAKMKSFENKSQKS